MVRRRVTLSKTQGEEDLTTTGSSSPSSGDDQHHLIPPAKWTFNKNGVPQAVAHRGYKAEFPENTMGAFRGAVAVGAQAIETDVHLSKDDVVVIAHDPSLKRCYGVDALVRDHDWAYLSTLRTLKSPRQPMPRLSDVLAWLAEEEEEQQQQQQQPPGDAPPTWLLLDIKVDDPADLMITRLAETLASSAASSSYWTSRVVLGCWTARHLRLCHERLPGFAIAWIGASLPLAREFLRVPHVAMNVRQEPLRAEPGGGRFVRECRGKGRPLYAWTVNDAGWMRWAIGRGLDAVITDDPRKYLEVVEEYRKEGRGRRSGSGGGVVATVREGFYATVVLRVLIGVVWLMMGKKYHKRYGSVAESREVLKGLAKA